MTLDHRWTAEFSIPHKPPMCYTLDLGKAVGEAEVEYINAQWYWYVWVGETGYSYRNAAERGTAGSFLEGQHMAEEAMKNLGMLKKEDP